MATAAQKLARQRYKEKNLELVAFEVKKGASAEYTAAASLGLGKMEMIRRAIEEYIANHASESFTKPQPTESLSAEQRKLLDEFGRLPADVQKTFSKLIKQFNQAQNQAE